MTDDRKQIEDALATLGELAPKYVYLTALESTQRNYPSQMTEEDRTECNAAYERLFAAANAGSSGDFVAEALRHCTKAGRGWCMWLHVMASFTADRLANLSENGD